jgi:V/A-type H+-transporting ATPase subunit E
MSHDPHGAASGVEALLARLRDEGVAAGRAEAERIVGEAERRAREILAAAETEAIALRESARAEAERHHRAGEEALRVAVRDAVLQLKQELSDRFAGRIAGAVSDAAQDPRMLERMILEVVGRARAESGVDAAEAVEVLLPRAAIGLEDLRRRPEELREGTLSHFVAAVAGDMLREGVAFGRAEDGAGGLRVELRDAAIMVDLSDGAVAEVILRHLQPRFRALLEGVVE